MYTQEYLQGPSHGPFLKVPSLREAVLWGCREDGSFLTGRVVLQAERQNVVKLILAYRKIIYGTFFGVMNDFDGEKVAMYFGSNGLVYYFYSHYDTDEHDEIGWPLKDGHGGGVLLTSLYPDKRLWEAT